jgi:phytoene synthase
MTERMSAEREAELAAHYRHCEMILRDRDRDCWLACLFAPSAKRSYLHAIYAFSIEIADVREKVTQPLLGEMRLRWWMDALVAAAGDEARGGAHAHPVADALLDTIERHGLAREELLDIVDAHIFDLYDDPMGALSELETYCNRTSAHPMRLSARILSGAERLEEEPFEQAGIALGLTQILRDLPKQAAAGQMFAPNALLATCGATEEDMRKGVDTPEVRAALAKLRSCARRHYEAALSRAGEVKAAQAALLPAALVPTYLDAMERKDYDPFRAQRPPPQWLRQWRLWRAARREGL